MSIPKLLVTALYPGDFRSETVDKAKQSLLDLSMLGVPIAAQSRRPTLTSYPRKFNPDALKVWKEMIEDREYQMEMKALEGRIDEQWHNSIVEFMARCEALEISPFGNNTTTTKNQYVYDFLNRARIQIVRYFNEIGMFERVKVRKSYRQYTIKETGIIVTSWCLCFPVKDEAFEKWLVTVPSPRYIKLPGNMYSHIRLPHINLWVRYLNYARVSVGFTIEVPGMIEIPDNLTPTRKAVNKFMDDQIWLPIVRANRIPAIKNRLF